VLGNHENVPTAMVLSNCEDHDRLPGSMSENEARARLEPIDTRLLPAVKATILTEPCVYKVSTRPSPFWGDVGSEAVDATGAVKTRRGAAKGAAGC